MDVLLVAARYPWPARRGDQLRTLQTLAFLTPAYRVTLLAPAPARPRSRPDDAPPRAAGPAARGTSPPLLPPGAELVLYRPGGALSRPLTAVGAAWRGLPLQGALFASPDLRRELRRLAPRHRLVILQLARLAACRDDLGAAPVLVDLIDDLALNLRRRARFDRPWLRPPLLLEARLLDRAHRSLAASAAALTVVCERDREELARRLPASLAARVTTARLAAPASPSAAPAGAAGSSASPAAPSPAMPAGPPRLVFTGNLGYFVNADAITWWLREVWPPLAARRPELELVVAGDRPARRVRRAVSRAASRSRVSLLAPAPDLGAVLAGATLALAPLRAGSGVPLKVLEAWSAGVPVVATAWAAAGTTAVPGEDLCLADTPAEWLAAIGRLLDDPAERARLAGNARRRLARDYSSAAAGAQLLAAVAAALSTPSAEERAGASPSLRPPGWDPAAPRR